MLAFPDSDTQGEPKARVERWTHSKYQRRQRVLSVEVRVRPLIASMLQHRANIQHTPRAAQRQTSEHSWRPLDTSATHGVLAFLTPPPTVRFRGILLHVSVVYLHATRRRLAQIIDLLRLLELHDRLRPRRHSMHELHSSASDRCDEDRGVYAHVPER